MNNGDSKITGRKVLAGLIGFFGLIFVANAIFVWLALESWTGLSTEDAYRKGLAFNDMLVRADAQRALGWRVETNFDVQAATRGRLSLALAGPGGGAIEGRDVTVVLRRPVVEGLDFEVNLPEAGKGVYAADISFPLPGQWDARIEVSRPGAAPYLVETRIWPR